MQNNMDPQTRRVIMEPCSNIRKLGRTALAGKWGKASIVIFLLTVLIEAPQFILNYFFGKEVVVDLAKQLNLGTQYQNMIYKYTFSPMSNVYILLITGPLAFGATLFFLNLFRNKDAQVSDLFKGFEQIVKTIGLFLYMVLFIILWSLIPIAGIILGPIAAFRYSQSIYVMIDHPEYPITMCVAESKRLMIENKGKYFILMLSFIGWILLAAFIGGCIGAVYGLMTQSTIEITGGAVQFDAVATFVIELLSLVIASPVMAYVMSTQVAFYEILTGKIEADVYYPGMY